MEPADQGDEGEWDTMGELAGSRSPSPTVEELLAQLERQAPAPQVSMEPAAAAAEEVVATGGHCTSCHRRRGGSDRRGARGGAHRG
jgi:mono/diheme cytochrome c family protein